MPPVMYREQFKDPREENRSRDMGDISSQQAEVLLKIAEDQYRRAKAIAEDNPLPPNIPLELAHVAVIRYNEF